MYLLEFFLSILKFFQILSVWQVVRCNTKVEVNEMELRKLSQLIHYFPIVVFMDREFIQLNVLGSKTHKRLKGGCKILT